MFLNYENKKRGKLEEVKTKDMKLFLLPSKRKANLLPSCSHGPTGISVNLPKLICKSVELAVFLK